MGILDRIAGRFDDLVGSDLDAQARARDEVTLARGWFDRGDLEDAVSAFGRAVAADGANAEAWVGLGDALSRLERFEPARDAYRRALTLPLAPEQRPFVQAGLGRLYAKMGRTGKAIRELRKAATALADDAETLAALGRVLVHAGEADGPDWLARAARAGGPPAVALLLEAAAAHREPAAAERLLREARELAPRNAEVRAAIARHLAGHGAITEAIAEAAAATALAPVDPGAWAALREVHAAAGNFRSALEAARREASAGRPPVFAVWLGLALGTEDRALVADALAHGAPEQPGYREALALVSGTLSPAGAAALIAHAPVGGPRLFVARTAAPPPVPSGNVHAMLTWAEAFAAGQPALLPLAASMARAAEAFDRPLLIAVMGEFNAGKSSFVNALAGVEIASVGVTPTTATINVLRYGPNGARVSYHDGTARDFSTDAVTKFLGTLNDDGAATIRQVEIFAPIPTLRRVEIVDTPGLNSLRAVHEKVARDFLVEADAIVWVFAAGQAAKATEREALALAHGAGKHVLAVLNKVDRASPDEVDEIVRHVRRELGDLVERVIPFSARSAFEARRGDDVTAMAAAGLTAVEAALETDFFARARQLKCETATGTLARFVSDARAAIAALPLPATDFEGERQVVDRAEQELRSGLASERVALRARLDAAFRAAAFEVREFVRPRAWLFGEHTADPEDERFLRDLLDDGAVAASAKTRAVFATAIASTRQVSIPTSSLALPIPVLAAAVDDAVERFRAYASGIIEGAAAVFFRVDLAGIRLEPAAIYNALARWSPDPDEWLFQPIEQAINLFVTQARSALDERRQTGEIAALMRRELLSSPLDALADAVVKLAAKPAVERSA